MNDSFPELPIRVSKPTKYLVNEIFYNLWDKVYRNAADRFEIYCGMQEITIIDNAIPLQHGANQNNNNA